MTSLKRASALAGTSIAASLALVLTGVTPASAVSYKSGSVTCTGTRTGYLVVQSVGKTRVILRSPAGGTVVNTTFNGGHRTFTAPNYQNFRWEVQLTGGGGDIQAAYSSCRI